MELVNVTNTSPDRPLVLRHDGEGDVVIAPGASRVVPLEYATVSFGHPAAKGDNRKVEYGLCRTLWGHYPGIDTEDDWERTRPRFEVTDLDGARIWMVLDDPEGVNGFSGPAAVDLADDSSVLKAMERMQAEIDRMAKILASGKGEDAAAAHASPISTSTEPPDTSGAMLESQAERNEHREDLPTPKTRPARRDTPRSPRTGSK